MSIRRLISRWVSVRKFGKNLVQSSTSTKHFIVYLCYRFFYVKEMTKMTVVIIVDTLPPFLSTVTLFSRYDNHVFPRLQSPHAIATHLADMMLILPWDMVSLYIRGKFHVTHEVDVILSPPHSWFSALSAQAALLESFRPYNIMSLPGLRTSHSI